MLVAVGALSAAQVAGGAATVQGGKVQDELNSRGLSPLDIPPPGSNYFEASVLANVKADEYVAVFGIVQEGSSPADCNAKVDATLKAFRTSLGKLGISQKEMYVDFIIQNRIYQYDVKDNVAKERLAGFELKKNISIHFRDRDMIDKLVAVAADAQIYDLIKVDYIVHDTRAVEAMLMQKAAAIVKEKAASIKATLGIEVGLPGQVIAQRFKTYLPTEMYGSYQAAEGEEVQLPYNRDWIVEHARRAKTYYFNPLDAKLFDQVINPVVLDPVVQFTVYLKVKYNHVPPAKAAVTSPRGTRTKRH